MCCIGKQPRAVVYTIILTDGGVLGQQSGSCLQTVNSGKRRSRHTSSRSWDGSCELLRNKDMFETEDSLHLALVLNNRKRSESVLCNSRAVRALGVCPV